MKLDVGCGDANLDLFYYGRGRIFIIGEADYLPLKNTETFKIYARHCLEHSDYLSDFFREVKRILKQEGILECI